MRLRWVITHIHYSNLNARLVVVGFIDTQLGAKPTASPTVSQCGRQTFLTVAGARRRRVFRCNNRLLHRSARDQELHIEPPVELAHAWNTDSASNCAVPSWNSKFKRSRRHRRRAHLHPSVPLGHRWRRGNSGELERKCCASTNTFVSGHKRCFRQRNLPGIPEIDLFLQV